MESNRRNNVKKNNKSAATTETYHHHQCCGTVQQMVKRHDMQTSGWRGKTQQWRQVASKSTTVGQQTSGGNSNRKEKIKAKISKQHTG